MGSILSRMRVAATLPMGGVDGLNKLRVHAKGPQGLQRNQKRGSAGGDHMQQSGRLYNQAVQLCIRPKEEIQLCFLKGVDAFRLAAAAFRQVPIEV